MPFTPLHMGPGLLLKGLAQGSFSLVVFGWSQILIDSQPLVVLLTGEGALYGWTHTLAGATQIVPAAAVTGKYAGSWGLTYLGLTRYGPIRWLPAVTLPYWGLTPTSVSMPSCTPTWPYSGPLATPRRCTGC